ncbi:hypothetical protein OSTOST_21014, partial [Ostertagia ostertagi]
MIEEKLLRIRNVHESEIYFVGDDCHAPASVRSMHLQNIYQVVSYCENISVCRRKLSLSILERWQKAVKLYDVSDEAIMILSAMTKMRNVTL